MLNEANSVKNASITDDLDIVSSDTFDISFQVKINIKVSIDVEDVADRKEIFPIHFENDEEYETYLNNLRNLDNYLDNQFITSSLKRNNYGSLYGNIKIKNDEYVSYKEICKHCDEDSCNSCKVCLGKKIIRCKECNKVGCKNCRQMGYLQCVNCNEEGRVVCTVCEGKKFILKNVKVISNASVKYTSAFNESTSKKVKDTITKFGNLEKLKEKDIVYINSTSNIEVVDNSIQIIYFMSCPFSFLMIRNNLGINELILYGISKKVVDLNNVTEKTLEKEEKKLLSTINNTNVIGGNYPELISSLADYCEIPIHQKILTARTNLIKRQLKAGYEDIWKEIDGVVSVNYVERVIKNIQSTLMLSKLCIQSGLMLPAILLFPFLYTFIGMYYENPLRLFVSTLVVFFVYLYSNILFNNAIRINGGEVLEKLQVTSL